MACEDFPCCGHEAGDCEGLLYGSDESIKADAMLHFECEHYAGFCAVADNEPDHDLDRDDLNADGIPWCYGCDDYATNCDANPEFYHNR